jgi:tellurite resistance protein TerC
LIQKFRFLKPALVLILFFVGVKMTLVQTDYKVDSDTSLIVILAILMLGAVASAMFPDKTPNGSNGDDEQNEANREDGASGA